MIRKDGRAHPEMRPVEIQPGYLELRPASCLIKMGRTWVLCTASVEERVPPFLEGKGQGWVTAEYAMLPGSTNHRSPRDRQSGGRSQEISRLIGRCLRAAVDLKKLGQRTITIDCDVIQADGGTRTASITGGYVALALATKGLRAAGTLKVDPIKQPVAAISGGIVKGELLLDLDYAEDSRADADLNVAMGESGNLVEIQGTAEAGAFPAEALDQLLSMAAEGTAQLMEAQKRAISGT